MASNQQSTMQSGASERHWGRGTWERERWYIAISTFLCCFCYCLLVQLLSSLYAYCEMYFPPPHHSSNPPPLSFAYHIYAIYFEGTKVKVSVDTQIMANLTLLTKHGQFACTLASYFLPVLLYTSPFDCSFWKSSLSHPTNNLVNPILPSSAHALQMCNNNIPILRPLLPPDLASYNYFSLSTSHFIYFHAFPTAASSTALSHLAFLLFQYAHLTSMRTTLSIHRHHLPRVISILSIVYTVCCRTCSRSWKRL